MSTENKPKETPKTDPQVMSLPREKPMEQPIEQVEPPTTIDIKNMAIEVRYLSNGRVAISRNNNGFTTFELLGVLELVRSELLKGLNGDLRPVN